MKWQGYRCTHCLAFQNVEGECSSCGLPEVLPVQVEAWGPSPVSSGAGRPAPTVSPHVSGLDPATLDLLTQIERLVGNHSFARAQQALGVALWRSISRTPHYAWQTHYDLSLLQLSDGGRRLRLTAVVFPPTPSGEKEPP
mgnify:CR=1 FL=1